MKIIPTYKINQAIKFINRAADAWERGNNSGNSEKLEKACKICDQLRSEAETILKEYGITTDYPGLYPTYKIENGFTFYDLESLQNNLIDKFNRGEL